jgi:hypothetical protein
MSSIFGGGNPFADKKSKISKTLIATPSKFELRVDKPKVAKRALSARSNKSGSLQKVEKKAGRPSKFE